MIKVLMLCHDQSLDRRVVAQCESWLKKKHKVTLLALSFDANNHVEQVAENFTVRRIGLNNIKPDNAIYKRYINWQVSLNNILNKFCNRHHRAAFLWNKIFRLCTKFNHFTYQASLLLYYRNRMITDPLPFRSAFFDAALPLSFDIIQVHDLPALKAGVELSKLKKVPIIYDAHELYPEQASFSKVQRTIAGKEENELIKHVDLVFAVNESIAQEMAQRYAIEKPVVLLNALNPTADFDCNIRYDIFREKLNIDANTKIVLFQGGYSPHRNLEFLVESMRYVKSEDVVLVMMGFGDLEIKLKAIANKYGLLEKKVYFYPGVSQSELLKHSASADIGVIPYPHVDLNSYYCTPNKLFEFILSGLPIVANDSPELNRFVRDEGFGITTKMHSVKEIAAGIDCALEQLSVSDWKKNILNKRHKFTWDVEEGKYLSALKKLSVQYEF